MANSVNTRLTNQQIIDALPSTKSRPINNTSIIGPPNSFFTFPVTLGTPDQLNDQQASLWTSPADCLIVCTEKAQARPKNLPDFTEYFTSHSTEAEFRADLYSQRPSWFQIHDQIHATVIQLNESGILIRGKPGSGKSSLMHELISHHGFSLIADDFADFYRIGDDQLVAGCPPANYGQYIIGNPRSYTKHYTTKVNRYAKMKLSVYLETKNIQNSSLINPIPNRELSLAGVNIPEWVLQPPEIEQIASFAIFLSQLEKEV